MSDACLFGDYNVARYFVSHNDIDVKLVDILIIFFLANTALPLIYATITGKLDIVKYFISLKLFDYKYKTIYFYIFLIQFFMLIFLMTFKINFFF